MLITLSMDADADGGSCFPSTRRLAERTGISRRHVEKHLRRGEAEGWITRTPIGEGKGWKRTSYDLLIPANVATESSQVTGEHGDGGYPPHPDNVVTEGIHVGAQRGDPEAGRGDPQYQIVATQGPLTSPETSLGTSPVLLRDSGRRDFLSLAKLPREGRGRTYPPEFSGAFEAMPDRHVSQPKADAYRTWRSATKLVDEVFQLEAAALAYRDDQMAQGQVGTRWVMMASTFFGSGERWKPYSGVPLEHVWTNPAGGYRDEAAAIDWTEEARKAEESAK